MSVLNVIKVTAAQYEQINTEEGYTTPDGTTYKEGDGNLYVVYGADLTAENMSAAWAGKTVSGDTLSVTKGVINLSNPNSGFALTTGDNGAGLQLNGARGGATQILTYDNPGICTNGTIAINQTGTLSGRYLTKMDNDGVTTTGVMKAHSVVAESGDMTKILVGTSPLSKLSIEDDIWQVSDDVNTSEQEEIGPGGISLDVFKDISLIEFHRTDDDESRPQIMIKALDLERKLESNNYPKIVSAIISTRDVEGTRRKYINSSKFPIILFGGIQKLIEKIERLESRVDQLEKKQQA